MGSWKDEVLFLGMGRDGVCHYRTYLPATRVGCDWVTQDTDGTIIQDHSKQKDHGYIVYQMPFHPFQVQQMLRMKDAGKTVILNLDDDLRAVKNMKQEHGLSHHFHKDLIKMHEEAVHQADHLIVSTEWLAERYKHPSTFVCRNGIDMPRYNQSAVPKPFELTIGWAGGTGHEWPMREIHHAVWEFIDQTPEAGLLIVGEPRVAGMFRDIDRVKYQPWADLWLYPKFIKAFDIGLAPAADHNFFRAKSELRFYEYGACGVPGIYSPITYGEEASESQLMASCEEHWLEHLFSLRDKERRDELGKAARGYVEEHVDIEVRAGEWEDALREIVQQ